MKRLGFQQNTKLFSFFYPYSKKFMKKNTVTNFMTVEKFLCNKFIPKNKNTDFNDAMFI